MSIKVPPNGGWGWIIVLGSALNGISTIPIIQAFGLIFKDSFAQLKLNATDTSIIINVNLAFGMLFGMINGALLKIFGYKKVAISGSILFTIGIMLTAFANSFALLIICYGILTSIGLGMSMSGFSLAVNSYFTTRRNRAMGLTITIIGIGPILMPQVASFLLAFYGIQATILLLAAYSLHSIIGGLLLQPVKWHMKNAPLCLETKVAESPKILKNNEGDTSTYNAEDETNIHSSRQTLNTYQRKRKMSSIDHDVEVGSIYGFDNLSRQVSVDRIMYDANYDTETSNNKIMKGPSMTNLNGNRKYSKYTLQNSAKSVESINLGSSIKIFDEPAPITKKLTFIDNGVSKNNGVNQTIMENNSLLEKETDNSTIEANYEDDHKDESAICRILHRLVNLYDFDLLRDPIYVNIMFGMSMAIFAEVNFSMLTPFILADMEMTTAQIANILSIIAVVDLLGRSVSPFLGEWLRQTPRKMYMLSLFLLIISRMVLIFVSSFTSVVIVAIGLGMAKGIRSVYMTLVVPSYVSIQKLPGASGMQMLTNGLMLICAGPMLGLIRDNTGNYTICIILMNSVTAATIFIWTIEMLIVRRKSTRRKSKLPETC